MFVVVGFFIVVLFVSKICFKLILNIFFKSSFIIKLFIFIMSINRIKRGVFLIINGMDVGILMIIKKI